MISKKPAQLSSWVRIRLSSKILFQKKNLDRDPIHLKWIAAGAGSLRRRHIVSSGLRQV